MIKKLNKIILVFLFLMVLSISVVSAADNMTSEIVSADENSVLAVEEVDDTIGVDSNEEILRNTKPGTFKDLQKLINNAKPGDTITLNKDYAYKKGDSEILINKALTINGKNHKIDGKSSTRIFTITGSNVKLNEIKFINANPYDPYYGDGWESDTSQGGAILWIGHNGYVNKCKFTNNHACYGSAVYWKGNNGTLSNNIFERNFDSETIMWKGNNGKLSGNTFIGNHARHNLISIEDCYCEIEFNTFLNNFGMSYIIASNLINCVKIENCIFFDNNNFDLIDREAFIIDDDNVNKSIFYIFRDISNPNVKVSKLIYSYENYDVDYYYENGTKIASGKLNEGIVLKNLAFGNHMIIMKYTNSKGKVITHYLDISTKGTYLKAKNILMFQNDGTQYILRLVYHRGTPLINKHVGISIFKDGEFNAYYYKTTDANGYIKLPIKQKAGNYDIFASCLEETSEEGFFMPILIKTTLKILKSPITQNKDLKAFYLGGTFKVRIIKINGESVGAGKTVKFTIAGKTYTKKTSKNGWVYLKIKQKPKTYTITTQYGKFKVKNTIIVKPLLIAKNIVKKKTKTIKFKVKLVNSKGKPQAKKKITFKFKGKKYKKLTNKKGIATLKIKRLKIGKYRIYTAYGVSKIKNTIKIKR
ncbi:bacterial Ig-like domain protein [Methanobrevibacter oralis]|uniref:Bacterial Ig-like domain protein n=1 Tax=Methanobrevibacter oralis TaxID=66851 RepID=A0A165ZTL3_METOA|nr:right-handed parallel beta-helix repeat-containing protein [Methanobrevibacter oralis]KZX11142.1 bacterial Ig-like domain protein [Methanobrevibacter oralis]